jgi:hypothetical protein
MTDSAKAIAFATHCLKWTDVSTEESMQGTIICDGTPHSILGFNPANTEDLKVVLTQFLGKRYFIQINRGTSSEFHWRVIVGWQDGTDKSKSSDHPVGVGEDLWDAIFDACVQAAGMFANA